MQLRRTANAGVLLELDGVSILLDGVCREVKPYPATPPSEKAALLAQRPDVVAFTHGHKDHYDPAFAVAYQAQEDGVILGPGDLPRCRTSQQPVCVKGVTVTPLASRHIGAAGKTTAHLSFLIQGTHCIWFLGDASPLQWKGRDELPKPDVLIVPYAYATTPVAWQLTQSLGAKWIVLLHLPERKLDTLGLWDAVEETTGFSETLCIPAMGQTLRYPL